jgi:hypothetical protein
MKTVLLGWAALFFQKIFRFLQKKRNTFGANFALLGRDRGKPANKKSSPKQDLTQEKYVGGR